MSIRQDINLGAIRYDFGFDIDKLLRETAQNLQKRGVKIAGVVQQNYPSDGICCEQMDLLDLRTQDVFRISQNLGRYAEGCRLDQYKLADVAGAITAAVSDGADLVLINKFGKAEAEGYGLLSCITDAIAAGIPVLTSVRPPYLDAWRLFHGGLASELAPVPSAPYDWCISVLGKTNTYEPRQENLS